MKASRHICMVITLSLMFFSATVMAEQIKFGDWVGIAGSGAASSAEGNRIGTFAKDGISTLWVAPSASDTDQIQLTLESKKEIVSDYFSYRIDRIDTLSIHSGIKGCNGNCLTDDLPKNGEMIKAMQKGLRIQFEYDSYPDESQEPAFSLRGFSRAYHWLVTGKK